MIDVNFDYLGLENDADYQNEEERRIAEEKAENALWDEADDVANPDLEVADLQLFAPLPVQSEALEAEDETAEQLERHSLIEEIEAESIEPLPDDEAASGVEAPRKQLKRDVQAAALARLEDSARTAADFERVTAWWDKLDANRERRERYYEVFRDGEDISLEYGASLDALCFPNTLCTAIEVQLRKGDFLDAIFDCPYDIHELVTAAYLSKILRDLPIDSKELLYLSAVRQYTAKKIATIREQTPRNINKLRVVMYAKIQKELLCALRKCAAKQQALTLLEKEFLADNAEAVDEAGNA